MHEIVQSINRVLHLSDGSGLLVARQWGGNDVEGSSGDYTSLSVNFFSYGVSLLIFPSGFSLPLALHG